MVVGGSSPANDVVITVESARAEGRSWSGETRAAVRNNGSGLRGWIAEEAVWMCAQFAKVALSVFVVRAVTKLFQTGAASQQAYVRAENLWTHGHDERVYTASSGAAWRPAGSGAGSQRGGGYSAGANSGNSSGDGTRRTVPENPRYVTTVGGYHLYLHNTLLDPARQQWPCPVLFTSACETCHFLEYDRGGTPHCAAVLKLRTVLDGVDGGESLEELRQWIRAHQPNP
jgi:hypothetical protein